MLLSGIGFLYSLLYLVLFLAVICVGGLIALRLLDKPKAAQLQTPDPKKELRNVQRILDQYKKQER